MFDLRLHSRSARRSEGMEEKDSLQNNAYIKIGV